MLFSRFSILSSVVLVTATILLTARPTLAVPTPADAKARWDYGATEGPEDWGFLTGDYEKCRTGLHQSPVDLALDKAVTSASFKDSVTYTNWKTSNWKIRNNGHTLKMTPEAKPAGGYGTDDNTGPSFTKDGKTYDVLEFHLHAPSEHRINGVHSDLELHIVAKERNGNTFFVHGIMWKVAPSSETDKVTFWSNLPDNVPEKAQADTDPEVPWQGVPLDQLLQFHDNFCDVYTYPGSLTVPPCSEAVTWAVSKKIMPLCLYKFNKLRQILGFSARSLQTSDVAPEVHPTAAQTY